MVVGMPFKDIATTDSIYLPEVPAVTDTASRKVTQQDATRHNTTQHYTAQHDTTRYDTCQHDSISTSFPASLTVLSMS